MADTDTGLYVHVMPRNLYPDEMLKRARKLYAAGVDGIGLWDTNTRSEVLRDWQLVSRLGHREDIDIRDSGAGVLYRNHNFTLLGHLRMDRYAPHWGS